MISVIVPAHNEEAVIGRCLEALVAGGGEGLEILVVCNGCTDATAEVAGGFGQPVKVLECPTASKAAALNMGDAAARGFPRFYVDADVVVSPGALEKVATALSDGRCLAAAPELRVDLSGSSLCVRLFYRTWLSLPYHREGMIGSGFYALSQEGRKRFDRLPEIIADDGFIRGLFSQEQRRTVRECHFTIRAPRRLRDLVKIKTRARLGGYELAMRYPGLATDGRNGHGGVLARHALRFWQWPAVAAYGGVNMAARIRAKRQLSRLESYQWERDETTRRAGAGG